MTTVMRTPREKAETSPSSLCPVCFSDGTYLFTGRDFYYDLDKEYHYHRCTRCGASYQHPLPGDEEIEGFYHDDDYYAYEVLGPRRVLSPVKSAVLKWSYGYSHIRVANWYRRVGKAASLMMYRDEIEFRGGGKALDVGCGNGRFVKYLNETGWDATGLDFSEAAIKACHAAGLTASRGTIESAGFREASFDLVTARHVIEHVSDPHSFAREVSRITKKGGRLVVRTPNAKALGGTLFGVYWFPNEIPRHIILYSSASLDLLLEKYGFRKSGSMTFSRSRNIRRSLQYALGRSGKARFMIPAMKPFMKLYVPLSTLLTMGDDLFVIYDKH